MLTNININNSENRLSAPMEEYLEALCRILDRCETPTATTLARELQVAAPSVVGMLKRMSDQGLILYEKRCPVILTPLGESAAMNLRRRHRLAERMLTDLLKMPWSRAHSLACSFEHVITAEIEPYLLKALNNPLTCPHGNPLSGEKGNEKDFTPLAQFTVGNQCEVCCITDENDELLNYLERVQITPGQIVKIIDIAPGNGPFLVEVNNERQALSVEAAGHIMVKIA
jgi:DtxR family Mn-dependent transcriptional regulator